MSEEKKKKEQPPKPEPGPIDGEDKTYTLYIIAGRITDTQFEELTQTLKELLRRISKRGSEE